VCASESSRDTHGMLRPLEAVAVCANAATRVQPGFPCGFPAVMHRDHPALGRFLGTPSEVRAAATSAGLAHEHQSPGCLPRGTCAVSGRSNADVFGGRCLEIDHNSRSINF
jgi:hypothetical protein